MKIFLWRNLDGASDFTDEANCAMPDSSDFHSGGCVVLAETEEEAIEMVKKYTEGMDLREAKSSNFDPEDDSSKPIILSLEKKGVVLYCDGNC